MGDRPSVDAIRAQAQEALASLRGLCTHDDVARAKALVEQLRDQRDFELMNQLAEAVRRREPEDAKNCRLYGQSLIESGMATTAIDMLQLLVRRLPKNDSERAEATGLIGRAYKQIFCDAGDKSRPDVRAALKNAIAAYKVPYEQDKSKTWHGVNLVALIARARVLGMRVSSKLSADTIAREVIATLSAMPKDRRDAWHLATLAEASLGLRNWDVIDGNIRQYMASGAAAFHIAGTLRQFTEVWDLENRDERGRDLVNMLRARLLELEGGELKVPTGELDRLRTQSRPDQSRLEAVLGTNGAQTYEWWKKGLERAAAVAAIRERLGTRIGTGFLVRGGDVGAEPANELFVLTNFHVVNERGAAPGLRPSDAEVVFEAADSGKRYGIAGIAWSSPADRHDASLLRLDAAVDGVEPMPLARALPALEETARVYVIGHPGGRELAFSFQDNELLDHEGPPSGDPPIPGVCRLHYRAPTEGGSSGSPVFNSRRWEVIGLHHKGGKLGMPKLNGKPGTYAANEGISIQSIAAAIHAERSA